MTQATAAIGFAIVTTLVLMVLVHYTIKAWRRYVIR